MRFLDVGGVKHNADAGAKRLRGKVVAEAAADDTLDTVGAADLTPDDAELRSVLGGLGAVDVRKLLAAVECGLLLGVNALDLDQGRVGVLVVLATLVTENGTLDIQAADFALGLGQLARGGLARVLHFEINKIHNLAL